MEEEEKEKGGENSNDGRGQRGKGKWEGDAQRTERKRLSFNLSFSSHLCLYKSRACLIPPVFKRELTDPAIYTSAYSDSVMFDPLLNLTFIPFISLCCKIRLSVVRYLHKGRQSM